MSTIKNDGRRDFLRGALALAATAIPAGCGASTPRAAAPGMTSATHGAVGRRRLGTLEVSSLGLGCMNVAWGMGPPIDRQDAVRLIPGTTKIPHLEENVAAANIALAAEDLDEIEKGMTALTLQGARSSEAVLGLIDTGSKLGTSSRAGHGVSPLREETKPVR